MGTSGVSVFIGFFFLSSFLFVSFLTSASEKSETIDLRTEKFTAKKIFPLDNSWQFYFGDFLTSTQMSQEEEKVYCDLPHTWTDKYWNGSKMPPHGRATYYLKISVDDDVNKIALKVRPLGTNYRVFVNNKLLGEVGVVGDSKENSKPFYKDMVYILPQHSGELEIIFHVSNYDYRKGGMWLTPVLGSIRAVYNHKSNMLLIEFLMVGAILFMGLYQLGIFIFRFQNYVSLVYGLVCIAIVLRAISVGEYILPEIFPGIPWNLLVKLEFISYYMVIGLTAILIQLLFPGYINPKITKGIFVLFMLFSFFTILFSVELASYLIIPSEGAALLSLGFIIYSVWPGIRQKQQEVIMFLVGLFIMSCILIIDVFFYSNNITTNSIFTIALVTLFFTYALIIAKRNSEAFMQVNSLSLELKKNNEQLESTVQIRTKVIRNKNEELSQKNIALEKLNYENDSIISILAHDLKAPFIRNKSLLELIPHSGQLNKDQKNITEMIKNSSEQGLKLISDLLLVYGERETQLEVISIDIEKFINELISSYQGLTSKKDISIIPTLKDKNIVLKSDQIRLTRILDNLISNAIKFSDRGKKILIIIEIEGKQLAIRVADEGPGISDRDQKDLFKRFKRLSAIPTGGESSTGLGLSIVKQLVEELGFEVKVESKIGKGSTFSIFIPYTHFTKN